MPPCRQETGSSQRSAPLKRQFSRLLADLDVSSGLVGDLHYELATFVSWLAHQVVQDEEVDGGTQVVNVGHKDVLLPFCD